MIETLAILGTVDLISPEPGWRQFGVPPGGAWDAESYLALELLGAQLIWEAATTAFGGSAFWRFQALESGSLTLLGLSGTVRKKNISFRLPCQLDVDAGDEVQVTAGDEGMRLLVGATRHRGRDVKLTMPPRNENVIRFIPFGETDELSATVSSQQDRVGIRLAGDFSPPPALARSEPSVLGAIQVVNGGLLVHGPEGPTTGGYPKMGVVASVSLPVLAQARPADKVRFIPITLEEALVLREARKRLIESWTSRIRLGLSVE